ncbi:MAG: hypothetical protein K2Q18_08410 [Bdellovibrionales bacterium]|nr:hypothetical protein [Bdellovibrionales bacterium]
MKKYACLSLLVLTNLLPQNLYAFHAITEVLPSNKIIVCKDSDQVRTGKKVEVYKLKFATSKSSRELVKTDEFELPSEGQKIELFHKEFHFKGKALPKFHDEKKGTATVIAPKLAGEKRNVFEVGNNKSERAVEKTVDITSQDEAEIAKKCFVAITDDQVNLKDVNSIAF